MIWCSAGSVVADPAVRPVRASFAVECRSRAVAEYEAAPHGAELAVPGRQGLQPSPMRKWMVAREVLNRGSPTRRRASDTGGTWR
jgi:hypothetical protein